jgi:hypothetical protein
MGQVIRFPTPLDAYPSNSSDLDDAEGILLLGLRWWVKDGRHRQDPLPRLRHGMDLAGTPESAQSVDALMSIAARTTRRSLEIHGPRCQCLSLDETQMLHAASLVQGGEDACAERVLRMALLTAQGADMALGPLRGIGRLFAAARLLLRRRPAPAEVAFDHPTTLH